jgi:hypothetical protein
MYVSTLRFELKCKFKGLILNYLNSLKKKKQLIRETIPFSAMASIWNCFYGCIWEMRSYIFKITI